MSRNRWILIAAIGAFVLALVGLYFHMPYRALEGINDSLEQGNTLGLATGITSQQLQAQLVEKERQKMERDLAEGREDSPYLLLGAAMAPLMAERMAWERVDADELRSQVVTAQGSSVFREADKSFDGLSRFVVAPNAPNAPTLVLVRQGLTWKTESIQLAD